MSLKMQWLITNLNTGQDNRPPGAIDTTNWMLSHQRGLIIAPTGYGKSGIIFYYIVERLRKAKTEGKKLVFTLSTPLLVLNDQFYTDLIEVLTNLDEDLINKDNCVFIDNSSDKSQQTGVVDARTRISKWGMNELRAELNKDKPVLPEFIFIISTHKSYNTLLSSKDNFVLGQLRTVDYETVCIFDESHTLVNGSMGNQDEEKHDNRDEKNDPIYMDELDKYADCIFLVSATPPKWQAEWLKEHL